jgi:alanyl-tRNA synthetase
MNSQDLRKKWYSFFESKKHLKVSSASLIPNNPTLLLTNAGMVPFVPYFLGQDKPPSSRVVSVQKCVRVGGKDSDLENIGTTPRHLSFFEMLGNFSFGDYFKEEVIPWSWELLTKEYGLNPEHLTVSVFEGDDEVGFDQQAYDIWHRKVGVPDSRIMKMGRADNFWGPPGGVSGPCGPCSEIYYHPPGADEGVEIWNLVFMQYEKREDGSLILLPKPNVDTGAGLERLATVLQGKENVFQTDLLSPIIDALSELAKLEGFTLDENCREVKIISDHLRCSAFLIGDGVKPSNLGRGYILRMLLRRAARFTKLLGFDLAHSDSLKHLEGLVQVIQKIYGSEYPELNNDRKIAYIFNTEIAAFNEVVEKGMKKFSDILDKSNKVIDGETAFDLYATYGFPVELTVDLAEEKGFKVDLEGYQKAREAHSEISNKGKFAVGFQSVQGSELEGLPTTQFIGYDTDKCEDAKVLFVGNDGEDDFIILDKTPCYAESGGQLSDTALFHVKDVDGFGHVKDVKKVGEIYVHKVDHEYFSKIKVGNTVSVRFYPQRRRGLTQHHTATHLLQAALRKVLGEGIQQAGSQVDENGLRFDFTHEKALSKEQTKEVEKEIKKFIDAQIDVQTKVLPHQQAIKEGALAFFGDKYGDEVRVLSIEEGNFKSVELCGGTHVKNTKEIGLIKILSETAIAAGTRRIEMMVGDALIEYLSEQTKELENLASELKVKPDEVKSRVKDLVQLSKDKDKKIAELEKQLLQFKLSALENKVVDLQGKKFLLEEVDFGNLKDALDILGNKFQNDYIFFLYCLKSEKPSYAIKVNPPSEGQNAKEIIQKVNALVGGSGGGRPDFAQGGGGSLEKFQKDELKKLFE